MFVWTRESPANYRGWPVTHGWMTITPTEGQWLFGQIFSVNRRLTIKLWLPGATREKGLGERGGRKQSELCPSSPGCMSGTRLPTLTPVITRFLATDLFFSLSPSDLLECPPLPPPTCRPLGGFEPKACWSWAPAHLPGPHCLPAPRSPPTRAPPSPSYLVPGCNSWESNLPLARPHQRVVVSLVEIKEWGWAEEKDYNSTPTPAPSYQTPSERTSVCVEEVLKT
ncbi:hypothetical protein RRG08_051925 [Elysia crispata]|uniref:Uncharacterized protein n=1 Tax=Elysia crispata TaxID=231223 RepID=A0AAE0Y2D2_9GAST|nr:hypothetical protein RRG08_051925 [Elysia crispata]